jgi:hypothetical protein
MFTMKKILILFLFSFTTSLLVAQEDDIVTDPAAREKIKAARAAYITERLELTTDEAEKFWPIYREYTEKRIDLFQQYRRAKKNESDDTKLLEMGLDIKQKELDLEKEYSQQFVKIISAQKLVALRQAELDFKRLVLRQIKQRQSQRPRRQR